MKTELPILFGIRWNNPSIEVISRETERFLDWITRIPIFREVSVYWNIPCTPFLEEKTGNLPHLITLIKKRIKSNKDKIFPMGYSGAILPLLSAAELDKEVSWCIANPWSSGIEDIFGIKPDTIIPVTTDLKRNTIIETFIKSGFSRVGTSVPGNEKADSRIETFTFTPVYPESVRQLKIIAKKQGSALNYPLYLFFDLSLIEETVKNPFEFDAMSDFLDVLAQRFTLTTTGAIKNANNGKGIFNIPRDQVQPNHPAIRASIRSLEKVRNSAKKTDIQYKNILKGLSFSGLIHAKSRKKSEEPPFPPKDRITIADMQGNAILSGEAFDAVFSGGRLIGLTANKKQLLPGIASEEFITTTGTMHRFRTASVSSIESERIRGLRVIGKIFISEEHEAGEHVTEYVFVEDSPYLLITMHIRYPGLSGIETIDSITPFELLLFSLDENEKASVAAYSGDSHTPEIIPEEESVRVLSGKYFCFNKDDYYITMGFLTRQGLIEGSIELKTEIKADKNSRTRLVRLNPFGTYQHVSSLYYGSLMEVISIYIGVSDTPPENEPSFLSSFLHEIPQ
jgi:hypothetical protein